MSRDAIGRIFFERHKLGPSVRLTAFALAYHTVTVGADRWPPPIWLLARATEQGEDTVRRNLRTLRRKGLLDVYPAPSEDPERGETRWFFKFPAYYHGALEPGNPRRQ